VIIGVFSRRSSFEVTGIVVPAIFVDVMNVEVGPEVVNLVVSVGGETMEVDVAVVTSSRIPHSNAGVVVQVELDARAEYHVNNPPVSSRTMEFAGQRRGPQGNLVTTEIRV
jgi:hypothetical protein